tara:strand:+ start:31 stop:738 length:708 start_codon:yes stop_codon:yes gene_type:complete
MKRFNSAKWITENKHGKPLMEKGTLQHEYGSFNTTSHRSSARSFSLPKSGPQKQAEPTNIMAAAFPSHEDYKTIYFGDDQEFRDEEFEYIEAFTAAPYILVMWNDTGIQSYRYDSEEEFTSDFSDMGYGECDERECGITEIIEVINNSQPDRDSMFGLALMTNGKVTAQGGEGNSGFDLSKNDTSIAGMEDEIDEGSCGYTTDANDKKLSTPGGTNEKSITAFAQSHLQELLNKK